MKTWWAKFLESMKANTGLSLTTFVVLVFSAGMLWPRIDAGVRLAENAATKEQFKAVVGAMGRQSAVQDSTLRVVLKLDASATARWESIGEDIEELKQDVRELQGATYRRGYDRGAADEAVYGPELARVTPKPPPSPNSLQGAWNHIGQAIDRRKYRDAAKKAAEMTNRQLDSLGIWPGKGPTP